MRTAMNISGDEQAWSKLGPSLMAFQARPLWRNNGLSITVLALFLLFFAGQALTGWSEHNAERFQQAQARLSLGAYLRSAHFLEATFENWESEFLQMAAYVILTVFLFQKGSAESKDPERIEAVDEDPAAHRDDPDVPGPVRKGGWYLRLYQHSLSLALVMLFLTSWTGHSISGAARANEERQQHGAPRLSVFQYMGTPRFWFESFQNWQSEFLAVAAIVLRWDSSRCASRTCPVYW